MCTTYYSGSYLLSLLYSIFFFVFPLLCCSHNSCFHAEMWPYQRWTSGDPLQGPSSDSDDEEFRVLAAPLLTTGSVPQAPPNSTDLSIKLLELMTNPDTIIESPGTNCGDGHLSGHSNLSSHKSPNPSSHFTSDFEPTASTSLLNLSSDPPASDSVSDKPQPVHGLFF